MLVAGVGIEPTSVANRATALPLDEPAICGRSERIRTFDLMLPEHALSNQAELHSEKSEQQNCEERERPHLGIVRRSVRLESNQCNPFIASAQVLVVPAGFEPALHGF
jgi:hypothetical protein